MTFYNRNKSHHPCIYAWVVRFMKLSYLAYPLEDTTIKSSYFAYSLEDATIKAS